MTYTLISSHGQHIIKQWLDSRHIYNSTPQRILDYANDAGTLKVNYLPCNLVITAGEARSGHVESLLLEDDCFTIETLEEENV